MPHRYRVGETVRPTVYVRRPEAAHEVVRPMPEDATGEPQYRLRDPADGVEIVSRECEVSPYSSGATPSGRF